ncbi:hypothetical protein E1287_34605 [Actinomadura sp. KC06]|uniref:hypothetical protein n=1 Tax=Actinomadura sp. KC06 TaxID=2530369 RepID=UPI0010E2186B|nr:hypothetical protein [Actinomadura sp. KC06]TDD27350.1 hypothetical protein E1287_34605 [Actinomadura sp. KC06]
MKSAYATWAGKVPPLSMQLLIYMALISKDSDDEPWFGQGHGALAEHALGREAPIEEKDIRAVERAVAPLLKEGAIVADRRPAPRSGGSRTVRYRLALPRGDAPRKTVDDPDVPRNPADERPTVSGGDVPRNPAERPTESDGTSHGNRGTEEKEDPGGERRGVSQAADERAAARRLHSRYGLTDLESAAVVKELRRRSPRPIKHLIPYMDGMAEGDLADIVEAVQTAPTAPPLTAVAGQATAEKPPAPVQRPILATIKTPLTPTEVDERGLPAVDERAAARERFQEINAQRKPGPQQQAN